MRRRFEVGLLVEPSHQQPARSSTRYRPALSDTLRWHESGQSPTSAPTRVAVSGMVLKVLTDARANLTES